MALLVNSARLILVLLLAAVLAGRGFAQTPAGYQRPPKAITEILDAPPTPLVSLSPTREHLLLIERLNYPTIADLAAPMLRLAGMRINPNTNGPQRAPRNVGLILQTVADGEQRRVALPARARIGFPSWSPDGKRLALLNTTADGIEGAYRVSNEQFATARTNGRLDRNQRPPARRRDWRLDSRWTRRTTDARDTSTQTRVQVGS